MRDHITVPSDENLVKSPCKGSSSTTQNHVTIPIEKLNASLETAKEEKAVTTEEAKEKSEETEEQKAECRYCQEEDFVSKMESPCDCSGSIKYIHRSCIDKWYSAKGYCILCEICRKSYGENYYPLPEIISSDDEGDNRNDEIREEPWSWTIPGTNTQISSPLAMAARANNSLIASMNKDFDWRRPTFGMIFGMLLVVLVGVLIIKDIINCVPPKEDTFNRFLYFTILGFSVPMYIMSWVLQCQRYRKEEREREIERERERSV